MDAAIEIRGLTKVYGGRKGPGKLALDAIDLTIPQGSIFGLLGPNGAGKSTTINILAGLVNKTAGSARVWGFDIEENPRNARRSIGIVPQEIHFDPFFTPYEMLELQAGLYGIPKGSRKSDELLKAVRLFDKRDAYSRTLSGGMKRRLLVAKAMVHTPPILVLDEPTAGVDIELRQQLWDYVRQLHREGVTIVLTTHYLEEAEELCDEIAIINHGKVIACEPTRKLVSRIEEKTVSVLLETPIVALPPELTSLGARLETPEQIVLQYTPREQSFSEILAALAAANLRIRDLSTQESDLEDVFLKLTRSENAA